MALLSDQQVDERLAAMEGWSREGDAIVKSFDRGDFVGSIELAHRVVEPAEQMNHHPDLEISWGSFTVRITTHSQGGLTESDFELAARVDEVASGSAAG